MSTTFSESSPTVQFHSPVPSPVHQIETAQSFAIWVASSWFQTSWPCFSGHPVYSLAVTCVHIQVMSSYSTFSSPLNGAHDLLVYTKHRAQLQYSIDVKYVPFHHLQCTSTRSFWWDEDQVYSTATFVHKVMNLSTLLQCQFQISSFPILKFPISTLPITILFPISLLFL